MADVMSFAEIDGQRAELLPTRTLLQTADSFGGLAGDLFHGSDLGGPNPGSDNILGNLTGGFTRTE